MIKNATIAGVGVDSAVYHAPSVVPRGNMEHLVSPSMLKAFGRCPLAWIQGYEPPPSEAKDWGNIMDCLLLTPKLWDSKFSVRPATYAAPKDHAKVKSGEIKQGDPLEWNGNATVCRKWVEAQGAKQIVPAGEAMDSTAAVKRFMQDEILSSLLAASDTQVEVQAYWHDPETNLILPLRCLIDLVPRAGSEWSSCLGDLKTTRSAAPRMFQGFAFSQKYHVQAAFDLDLYRAATGEDRNTWVFALQENFAPWTTGREMVGQETATAPGFIELGRWEYQSTLARYCQCLASGYWPDYDHEIDGWTIMRPTPWQIQGVLEMTGTKSLPDPEWVKDLPDENAELIP